MGGALTAGCRDGVGPLPDGGGLPSPGPQIMDSGSASEDTGTELVDGGTTGPRPDSGPSCEPLTCAHQGLDCGLTDDGCGQPLDCGVCGQWTRMSDEGAREGSRLGALIWTGAEVFVWAGINRVGPPTPVGGVYDPAQDAWRGVSELDAPPATTQPCATSLVGHAFVFGGSVPGSVTNEGGYYDLSTDIWRSLPQQGAPSARTRPACAEIDGKAAVLGGARREDSDGALYDPATHSWSAIPSSPVPFDFPVMVSTGRSLIVGPGPWLAYDVQQGTWRTLPTEGAPSQRASAGMVNTPLGVMVFGGVTANGDRLDDAYLLTENPDTWTRLSTEGGPSPRKPAVMAWTGQEVLMWGCQRGCRDGFHFNLQTQTWRPMARNLDIGSPQEAQGVWTGEELIVWGGSQGFGPQSSGWRYRP